MIGGRITVLVRGTNDVASAVARALHESTYAVVLHEDGPPATSRRGMAFADAVFDGTAQLAGVTAERVDDPARIVAALGAAGRVPLTLAPLADVLRLVEPEVLVDARMRKRAVPEPQRGWAPLTVGLGPNFVAGHTVDVAIETAWGDALGAVVESGSPSALAGEPRAILGHTRDRFVYAPAAGIFRTGRTIGELVKTGEVIGTIASTPLTAPLAGLLRALTRDGVPVTAGTKVIEIDPRGAGAVYQGIGERPVRIATGVMEALRRWREGGVVRWVGAQREVLAGDFRSHVNLSSLAELSHLYGLGPLAGLRGEISIFDGFAAVSRVRDGRDETAVGPAPAAVEAPFLVYAQVAAWDERVLAHAVEDLGRLDAIVCDAARDRKLDVARPVPFLLRSVAAWAEFHVLDKRDDAPHDAREHERIKVRFTLSASPLEILGFRSDRHRGVFTPSDSSVHLHCRTPDGRRSGHVDQLRLPGGTVLALPRRWPASADSLPS